MSEGSGTEPNAAKGRRHSTGKRLKAAEEALRESESRFRALVETTSDWIWEVDERVIYTYASPKVRDLLGYEPAEVIGKTPFDLMPHEEADRVRCLFTSILAAARPFAGLENVNLHKDGRPVVLETSGIPILDAEGRLRGYRGIDRDITARKKAEEELRRLEAQVQQSQKLESLGILAGGIAHDFNNLLTPILGHANLAKLALPSSSPARNNLREIETAAVRAAELCRQMLAYAGMGECKVETLDLSLLVQELIQLLQVSIPKKATLCCCLAESLPAVEADPAHLRQVVMNLVINASEAIGDNGGVITISTGVMHCDEAYLRTAHAPETSAPGRYVYVEVADTGHGMDDATLTKIFDPFFTTKFAGRGLGLAAVLGIVRSHRGAITVESKPGRGTSFRLSLPASNNLRTRREPEAAAELRRGSGTILLADDDESVLEVTRDILEYCGFEVMTAANGREALSIYQKHSGEILCVLLDLAMPHMDGEETFRELRRIRPDVRVIVASGYSEQEITKRFAGQGVAGFVAKPYQAAALSAKLHEVLK